MGELTGWIKKIADRKCDDCNLTWGERISLRVFMMAKNGNLKACKLILDRIEPPQTGVSLQLNQFLVRTDLNDRLDALKECDVERLLPAEV